MAEMFGGAPGRGISSTANAYMLIYRLHNQSAQEPLIGDDEIPDDVKAEVLRGDEQEKERKTVRQHNSQKMQLKIVKDPDSDLSQQSKIVFVDRSEDTLLSLMSKVLELFSIEEEAAENYRLRAFNV